MARRPDSVRVNLRRPERGATCTPSLALRQEGNALRNSLKHEQNHIGDVRRVFWDGGKTGNVPERTTEPPQHVVNDNERRAQVAAETRANLEGRCLDQRAGRFIKTTEHLSVHMAGLCDPQALLLGFPQPVLQDAAVLVGAVQISPQLLQLVDLLLQTFGGCMAAGEVGEFASESQLAD
ncbi:hypothetical protein EYF80_001265 [Liparis tanakae]|uniref:Uncharacterized protein n=1 Tax=Liparis tanakae TaxID=230148 RepID=A0A4Z2JGW2_9TELE|nr:hypothetical protein EYF80_001265 [Liparis tanakae]